MSYSKLFLAILLICFYNLMYEPTVLSFHWGKRKAAIAMNLKSKKLKKFNYIQIVFVFLAFLLMVIISYFYTSRILRKQLHSLSELSLNISQTEATANLSATEASFVKMFETVENMLHSGKSKEEILYFLTDINEFYRKSPSSLPNFLKAYAYLHGEYLDGSGWIPPADFKPAGRPWYVGANKNDGILFFSDPYQDSETGMYVLSYSRELFDQAGSSCGILAMNFTLEEMTDYANILGFTEDSYTILVNNLSKIIAHPDDEYLGRNLTGMGNGYKKIAAMLEEEKMINAFSFKDSEQKKHIAFFRPVSDELYLGIISPQSSYYKSVYILAFILFTAGILLTIILCFLLIRDHIRTGASRILFPVSAMEKIETEISEYFGKEGLPTGHWSQTRVLVIDKNRNNRDYFKNIASKIGFVCQTASNPITARRILAEEKLFHIFFIHQDDTGNQALLFIREIREYWNLSIPIVSISNLPETEAENASIKPLWDKLLTEPFSVSSIIGCMKDLLPNSNASLGQP